MYLKNLHIENFGPIENLDIEFPFNEKSPKPIIFVGLNGSGKTVILSTIVDALQEMQSKSKIQDSQCIGNGFTHPYFKPLARRNIRMGAHSYISALLFKENDKNIIFLDNFLKKSKETFDAETNNLYDLSWPKKEKNLFKTFTKMDKEEMYDIFSKDAYLYFPANRYEEPFWKNEELYNKTKDAVYGKLEKPIEVLNTLGLNLNWLIDVVSDRDSIYKTICSILSLIIGKDISLGRFERTLLGQNRITLAIEDKPLLPLLSNLSLGQIQLFNIFCTILRYTDTGIDREHSIDEKLNSLRGIVLIDEVENHLHNDLIVNVLPKIFKMFPNIQFILTSHSPLFLLGMEREFGENGIKIYDLSEKTYISSKDFSEFQEIYNTIVDKRIIQEVLEKSTEEIIVATEGKTDATILEYAWSKLYPELKSPFKFTGMREETQSGAKGLQSLMQNIQNLPITHKIIALFDNDEAGYGQWNGLGTYDNYILSENIPYKMKGNFYALPLPTIKGKEIYAENKCLEIENYFPDSVIQKYSEQKWKCKQCKGAISELVLEFKDTQKKEFSETIVKDLPKEDFLNFKSLFDTLIQISKNPCPKQV